jgi:hypothetical protein
MTNATCTLTGCVGSPSRASASRASSTESTHYHFQWIHILHFRYVVFVIIVGIFAFGDYQLHATVGTHHNAYVVVACTPGAVMCAGRRTACVIVTVVILTLFLVVRPIRIIRSVSATRR